MKSKKVLATEASQEVLATEASQEVLATEASQEVLATEASQEVLATETKADEAKAEAEKLMAKAKEMAEIAKKAAKEAKEAAKKVKALTSRPVRLTRFVAMIAEDQEATILAKGDVHYCVEKAAIDEVLRQREQDEEPRTITIYKAKKDPESPKNDLPGSYIEVSRVYLDPETKQVVID